MLLQLVGKLCYITAGELIPGVSRRPHYWIQTNLPLCYLELYTSSHSIDCYVTFVYSPASVPEEALSCCLRYLRAHAHAYMGRPPSRRPYLFTGINVGNCASATQLPLFSIASHA
jgi:hypothetical protein